jgi:hypothetical protein
MILFRRCKHWGATGEESKTEREIQKKGKDGRGEINVVKTEMNYEKCRKGKENKRKT